MSIVEIIARGGGGGSGGGGGGAGGIFVGWAYVIGLICQWLMKKVPKPLNVILTVLFSLFAVFVSTRLPLGGIFAVAAVVGVILGVTGMLDRMHGYLKKSLKAKKELQKAALSDQQWDWQSIQPSIEKIFYQFQTDWANFDFESFQTYMTPDYFRRTMLLLGILKSMGRQNRMNNVKIAQAIPVAFHGDADDARDTLTVAIEASADDELWEGEQKLYTDKSSFVEEWTFVRNQNDTAWILSSIAQSTRTPWMEMNRLQEFAAQNGFYYSGDFGWLLMPKRGQLFSKANFKTSDINSHIAGVYHNLMVQFYVYAPNAQQQNNRYVIAQAALPKSYGNIVVRRKKAWQWGGIKGLTKVTLEWGDFNKMYEVYASDMERVTSFELLHPVFMEKLHALPFEVNIEVVDNVVYLYTQDTKASYDYMMAILKDAFDEMKL